VELNIVMSVTASTLEAMSLKELAALEGRIATLISRKHDQALTEAREKASLAIATARAQVAEKLTGIARDYGLKPAEVVGGNGKTHKVKAKRMRTFKRRAPIVAKYRDPNDATRTWSGKGPAPRWMKDSGQPKEHFLVAK